ncbi:DUF1942 domain-containing protein [Mycobacteroides franklinii]|uniref:DUF1942 domain-containing protein n=1 Tax=Mycobacteroides franklinii TaxID=948102 RepID=UPI0013E8C8A9
MPSRQENRSDGTGALCFDVDGWVPTCVVCDNGVTDLLIWEIIPSVLITHQKGAAFPPGCRSGDLTN